MGEDSRGVRPIEEVAADLGIGAEQLVSYGQDMAKVRPEAREGPRPGRLVLVSAITPTSAGEGKTTTSIGLAQGLTCLGERVCLALREPSLGPVFGARGEPPVADARCWCPATRSTSTSPATSTRSPAPTTCCRR